MTHYLDRLTEEKEVSNYAAADIITMIDRIAATMTRDGIFMVEVTWIDRMEKPIALKVRR